MAFTKEDAQVRSPNAAERVAPLPLGAAPGGSCGSEKSDRYCEVNRILGAALDLEAGQRKPFIGEACRSHPDLEKSVLRLLAISENLDGFMDMPPPACEAMKAGDVLLGRFRLVRSLGEGGMGSVFLAQDRELDEVAIKTIRLDLRNDPRALDRFRAEVRLARRVAHPNVCRIYDLFTGADSPFLTMQYCPGETLAHRLARGPMSPGEALPIARGIAAGLDAMHAEGIVHRDLKPSNIVLHEMSGGSIRPVITDFGLATGNSDCGAGQVLGSPDYMAPEQFRGTVARTVDIFAFGVVLFEIITGVRPWPKEDVLQAALRRVCDDAPRLRSVRPQAPEAWDFAIARALSRNPAVRFESAAALARALETDALPPVARRTLRDGGRGCAARHATGR
jgi:serine/threonine protein kinase